MTGEPDIGSLTAQRFPKTGAFWSQIAGAGGNQRIVPQTEVYLSTDTTKAPNAAAANGLISCPPEG